MTSLLFSPEIVMGTFHIYHVDDVCFSVRVYQVKVYLYICRIPSSHTLNAKHRLILNAKHYIKTE